MFYVCHIGFMGSCEIVDIQVQWYPYECIPKRWWYLKVKYESDISVVVEYKYVE